MKVLWVTNIRLPVICELQNRKDIPYAGGWLSRISQGLLQTEGLELTVCYPSDHEESGCFENLAYYGIGYPRRAIRWGKLNDKKGIRKAREILLKVKPDIIHIHGTEFQYHAYFALAAESLGRASHCVVSLQGLLGEYVNSYAVGLPKQIIYRFTLRELLNADNVSSGVSHYQRRAVYEQLTLRSCRHIMGRTGWDRGVALCANPDAVYHTGNETLRLPFYSDCWSYQSCVPGRIFISQAIYPIKGFHLFIPAFARILQHYPNACVRVAGPNIIGGNALTGSSYGRYLSRLMKKYGLEDKVTFCGVLNEQKMKEELLLANVFVLPSTVENSPNSVGEAMLLGVPVVASAVGGVPDMLTDEKEGLLYPAERPEKLAECLEKVFSMKENVGDMTAAARSRAEKVHDYAVNMRQLMDVYRIVAEDF